MKNPNERQVGGDHYRKAGGAQHWDMLAMCGYGWEYYKGRATAYLTRVKTPDEDNEKAGHFIEKLIWLIDTRAVPQIFRPTATPKQAIITYLRSTYFPGNGIAVNSPVAEAIELIMVAQTRQDLQVIMEKIAQIEHARMTRGYLGREAEQNTEVINNPTMQAGASPGWTETTGGTGWPFATKPAEEQPAEFKSGGGGDFGGGGADRDWTQVVEEGKITDSKLAPVDSDRIISIDGGGGSDMGACARADYSPAPASETSYSSSSSSDSGGSSGGGDS